MIGSRKKYSCTDLAWYLMISNCDLELADEVAPRTTRRAQYLRADAVTNCAVVMVACLNLRNAVDQVVELYPSRCSYDVLIRTFLKVFTTKCVCMHLLQILLEHKSPRFGLVCWHCAPGTISQELDALLLKPWCVVPKFPGRSRYCLSTLVPYLQRATKSQQELLEIWWDCLFAWWC